MRMIREEIIRGSIEPKIFVQDVKSLKLIKKLITAT